MSHSKVDWDDSVSSRGRLIVFEGPDGVGKSTVAAAVSDRLEAKGVALRTLSFPGRSDGTLGRLVYDVHHDPARFGIERMDQTSLQVLHIAAHIDTIENTIRPLIESGVWVILDRYWWSTWVYGAAYGVPRNSLEAMISLELKHWATIQPDLMFLIDREEPVRAESDSEQYRALRALYTDIATREKARHAVHTLTNEGALIKTVDESLQEIDRLA